MSMYLDEKLLDSNYVATFLLDVAGVSKTRQR